MKVFLVAAIVVLMAQSASAEHQIALVQSKGSSLVLAKVERKTDLFAEFKGRTRISGTLVAEWIGGTNNLNYEKPDYSLLPDSASIRRLPHFSGYRVRFIELQNGQAALEIAAGKAKADLLLKRKVAQVKVTGSFTIDSYVVGVECDASWAKATLVSADIPNKDFAAILEPIEGC
jgi:hypothetical protein